jgi:hypothetical protein
MTQQLTEMTTSKLRFDPQKEQVQIRFDAAEDGFATLVVFGPDGAWLFSLSESRIQAGANTVVWQGRDNTGALVPDGLYTLELFGFDRARRPAAAGALSGQVEICNYRSDAQRSDIHTRLARFRLSDPLAPTELSARRLPRLSVYAAS